MRGQIYHEQAYAQGKMLKSDSWNGLLPRNITPSDIDLGFDSRGRFIVVEYSSSLDNWMDVQIGQRNFYWAVISHRDTAWPAIAVLCKHSVPHDQQIDTKTDVDGYSIMFDRDGEMALLPVRADAKLTADEKWEKLVVAWCNDARHTMKLIRAEYDSRN